MNSNLLDPLLLNSSFYQDSINPNSSFWGFLKPFQQYSFSSIFINVIFPIIFFLAILFILKLKYNLKNKREINSQVGNNWINNQSTNYYIPY